MALNHKKKIYKKKNHNLKNNPTSNKINISNKVNNNKIKIKHKNNNNSINNSFNIHILKISIIKIVNRYKNMNI
jgi:hypothetical protein